MALYPGYEVPEFPERFIWKVTLPKARKPPPDAATTAKPAEPGQVGSAAPVFFLGLNGRLILAGSIPPGTEVKLLETQAFGGKIYYTVARDQVTNLDPTLSSAERLWLQGIFLAPAGLVAPGK